MVRAFVQAAAALVSLGAVLDSGAAHKARTGSDHLRIICQAAGIPLARADEVLALTGLGK